MAINATATASTYNQEPRQRLGVNYVIGRVTPSAKTLSDIILLARVPNKATIVDVKTKGATGGTAAVYKIGIKGGNSGPAGGSGADTTLLSTVDAATTTVTTGNGFLGWKVSLSDTDAQVGADVYITLISGTWTITVTIDYQIAWVPDGAGV